MRTHKFRVWFIPRHSFIDYGDLVLDLNNGRIYVGDCANSEDTVDVTTSVELLQYTGLEDIKGAEIYDKHVAYDELLDVYGVIQFKEGCYYFEWEDISEQLSEVHQDIEVIGTVFEYEDLLEG